MGKKQNYSLFSDLADYRKPQRYIGNELNSVKKGHPGKISVCISYPNFYEIGMDNLGIRIIYGLINSYPDFVCERVFLPGRDLLEALKDKNAPLFSLETKTPLNQFELIGFNFDHELNYLNFLEILAAGKIPLRSSQRKKSIVIGGGITNPEPLADFVDIFCLGEFEAIAPKLITVLRKYKSKDSRLKSLARIEGFYVPAFYKPYFYGNSLCLEKRFEPALFPLKRVKVKNLDQSFFPLKWLTPHTQISQDRVAVEIARGCPNNCYFCQARNNYYPYREKKVKTIIRTIETIYKETGYESFSLLSLSASDYSDIHKLLNELYPFIKKNRISINLPSLRIDKNLEPLYHKLLSLGKTSLTVAAEAGNDSLRRQMNKNINIKKLFESAGTFARLGLKSIKIYFIYGLLQEKQSDLLSIGDFIRRLQKESSLEIKAGINLFIPKPNSFWEKMGFIGLESAKRRKEIIVSNLPKNKKIKVSFSNISSSLIETILSRGTRELGPVLYQLHKRYSRLQEANQQFSWPIWKEVMAKLQVPWQEYLEPKTNSFPLVLYRRSQPVCKIKNSS